ncbi:hypothetical protein Ciccas_011521 [Cichlidogyrus casuarinus]|uniref:Uncharacterized protein n=1 Tax=Cichlidogyrus casuarinus TaxID=1844966 RepID=A0ABD2PRV4_9PLAT
MALAILFHALLASEIASITEIILMDSKKLNRTLSHLADASLNNTNFWIVRTTKNYRYPSTLDV